MIFTNVCMCVQVNINTSDDLYIYGVRRVNTDGYALEEDFNPLIWRINLNK